MKKKSNRRNAAKTTKANGIALEKKILAYSVAAGAAWARAAGLGFSAGTNGSSSTSFAAVSSIWPMELRRSQNAARTSPIMMITATMMPANNAPITSHVLLCCGAGVAAGGAGMGGVSSMDEIWPWITRIAAVLPTGWDETSQSPAGAKSNPKMPAESDEVDSE